MGEGGGHGEEGRVPYTAPPPSPDTGRSSSSWPLCAGRKYTVLPVSLPRAHAPKAAKSGAMLLALARDPGWPAWGVVGVNDR